MTELENEQEHAEWVGRAVEVAAAVTAAEATALRKERYDPPDAKAVLRWDVMTRVLQGLPFPSVSSE